MSEMGPNDGDRTPDGTPEATADERAEETRPADAGEESAAEQRARARHAHADAEALGGPEQPITWSAPSGQQFETPPYGTPPAPQGPAPQDQYQYGAQSPTQQYEPPRYEMPHYESPNYAAPSYESPNYEGQQLFTPAFQPLAPSTPPPGVQQSAQPAPQRPGLQQQAAPQQPRHYAPEPGGYPPQPPYAAAESVQQYAQQQYPQQQYPQQQAQHTPPPVEPPPVPRPEDLLVPNQSPVTIEPASHGWRGRVNRGSFGLVKAKPGPEEVVLRQAIVGIQRSFSRPMTVVVVQPKGGAGKTPTTICLSAAFGAHRGGYVAGWDDNETRGTLAVRVANPDDKRTTVWDLLSDLAAFERFDARVGDLSYYVRAQPDAHFDALVSDDNPGNMAQIGEDEFHRLHRVLQRFYRMIVVDTGNNVRSPNWQAAVNAADLVVVVSTYQRDAGYSGSWVLDHLAQTGREELARNAVTVLTAADPTTDKTVRDQLIEHFSARTRAVAEIPYDQQLAHGGPIRWTDLAPRTRNAWILAGATIVDALVEHDQQALAARRA